jgi:hypothetical protein
MLSDIMRPIMRRQNFGTLVVCLLALSCIAAAEGFTSLFDGASLDGWEGSTDVFRVVDGAIVGGTLEHGLPHNEFLCSRQEYGDFDLRLKFKVRGKGANAGVQFRSARIPNHHEVRGYQADLGDGYWGSLYDESRRRKILVKADPAVVAASLHRDEWNDYRIRCQGPRIRIWLNGEQTVDYIEPDADIPRAGIIGLQIHGGGPSDASYKDIEIKPL